MPIRENEQLRQLVGDYYHGLTTEDSYREQRAKLLDNLGIAHDDGRDTETRPRAESEPDALDASDAPREQGRSAGSGAKLFFGVLVLAGVSLAAFLYLTPRGGDVGRAGDPELTGIASETFAGGSGEQLVREFLSGNDWSRENLNNFLLAWDALPEEQRVAIRDGRVYRRLTTRLHQRISEELALGNTVEGEQLETITDFAVAIGAPYRRTEAASAETEAPGTRGQSTVAQQAEAPAVSDEVPPTGDEHRPDTGETESAPVIGFDSGETDGLLGEFPEEPAQKSVTESEVQADRPLPPPGDVDINTTHDANGADDACPASLASTRIPYCQDTLSDGSDGPSLVILPAGSFRMGSDLYDTESPVHEVRIDYHIAMSRFEITAGEYARFCSATGRKCEPQPWGASAPAVSVSWTDATAYAEWLSQTTGFKYRLPTEAEWEYAARAGTETPYFFGDEITPSSAHSIENGDADAPMTTANRSVNRNNFRLYHMAGNVREWVQDVWYPNHVNAPGDGRARTGDAGAPRVVRGGSYLDPGPKLRSAAREALDHAHSDLVTGIRIVREIER